MNKVVKRILIIALSVVFGLLALLLGLDLTVVYAEKSWENWYADYEKKDISDILYKTEKTDADYQVLFKQTGLTKLGIDGLLEKGEYSKIYKIQDFYFKDQEVSCHSFFPYTYIEMLKGNRGILCELEDGDIIVSATTHSFFLRVGHATIVVDGKNQLVGESLCPGAETEIVGAGTMTDLANYMVLRPTKIPEETRKQVAAYVKNELMGVPYDATIGLFSKKYPDELKKTQCAHLCWYGYKKFGYDIDGNGGLFVKPQDIANSKYFEVVQIFGFNPETLWK